MDNNLLYIISFVILLILLVIIIIVIYRKRKILHLRRQTTELERQRNLIVSTPIMSEFLRLKY